MNDRASFQVDLDHSSDIERQTLVLSGVIDENADLTFLEKLTRPTRLNLRHVRRLNSYGVRAWIEAIRKVPEHIFLELVECPPSVVDQINMVAGFAGRGRIVSFFAPMVCEGCGHEQDQLFTVADFRVLGHLPQALCPKCQRVMQVDDLEEQYLLFARDPNV